MAFGTGTAGVISRSTNQTAQTAEKTDKDGKITEVTTYGSRKEVTVETFADTGGTTAVSGQSGATAIIGDAYEQTNTTYATNRVTTLTVNT